RRRLGALHAAPVPGAVSRRPPGAGAGRVLLPVAGALLLHVAAAAPPLCRRLGALAVAAVPRSDQRRQGTVPLHLLFGTEGGGAARLPRRRARRFGEERAAEASWPRALTGPRRRSRATPSSL